MGRHNFPLFAGYGGYLFDSFHIIEVVTLKSNTYFKILKFAIL
jgi:hypothetical protein